MGNKIGKLNSNTKKLTCGRHPRARASYEDKCKREVDIFNLLENYSTYYIIINIYSISM